MNLLILKPADLLSENIYCVKDGRATHLLEILQKKPGDVIRLAILNGAIGRGIINSVECDQVTIQIEKLEKVVAPKVEIDLICALPRPQTLKKVLSVSAAMGVRKLMLIRSNRVEKSFFGSKLLKENEMEGFLIEGLAQGKRTRLPLVSIHDRFRLFFEDELELNNNSATELRLLADPEASQTLDRVIGDGYSRVVIAIGPEGGWNDFEIDLVTGLGFKRYSLGSSILRVEYAVTAALAQLEMFTSSNKATNHLR